MVDAADLVVLVDSEPSRREVLRKALLECGFVVEAVASEDAVPGALQGKRGLVLVTGRPGPSEGVATVAGLSPRFVVVEPDVSPSNGALGRGATRPGIEEAFRSLGDGLGVLDARGAVRLANPALQRLLDGSHSLEEWLEGRGAAAHDGPFLRASRSLRREVEEWTTGRRRTRVAVDPLPEADGSFGGAVLSIAELAPPRATLAVAMGGTAEGREAEARITQLEQDVRILQQFSVSQPREAESPVAAPSEPLRKGRPAEFCELVDRYERLMDLVLEQRSYRVDHHTGDGLRALAEALGGLGAGPRDVVEVHSTALRRKSAGVAPARAHAYAAEGRLMVLELMGDLVAYYRSHLAGTQ